MASLTVSAFGMQLHAATTVDGRDRKQLERLCRYMLRPPFAHDAVQALEGGRGCVHFKAPWRSGAAHADMSPDKFLARLCGLVPPPGFHMTRYFGVFANRHHLRARIIPPAALQRSPEWVRACHGKMTRRDLGDHIGFGPEEAARTGAVVA